MRRPPCLAILILTGIAPWSVTGQSARGDRLAAARAELHAMQLDSAALLLRAILDSAGRGSRDEQIEAWLLLGVVHFYQGDDSGTAVAFRHALVLEPRLEAQGLARYDSALVVLFEAQRPVAAANSPSAAGSAGTVVDCTRRCPKDVALPRLIVFPELEGLAPDRFDAEHGRGGALTFRFVVDTAGRVATGSVTVVASTLRLKDLGRVVLQSLEKARFTPARATRGQLVSVLVEGRLRFWNGRLEADVPVHPN